MILYIRMWVASKRRIGQEG